ncbi:hypothetical protein ACE6H2_010559 [Prunus campanulata]
MNNSRDCFLLLEMLQMVFLCFLLICSDYLFIFFCNLWKLLTDFYLCDDFV